MFKNLKAVYNPLEPGEELGQKFLTYLDTREGQALLATTPQNRRAIPMPGEDSDSPLPCYETYVTPMRRRRARLNNYGRTMSKWLGAATVIGAKHLVSDSAVSDEGVTEPYQMAVLAGVCMAALVVTLGSAEAYNAYKTYNGRKHDGLLYLKHKSRIAELGLSFASGCLAAIPWYFVDAKTQDLMRDRANDYATDMGLITAYSLTLNSVGDFVSQLVHCVTGYLCHRIINESEGSIPVFLNQRTSKRRRILLDVVSPIFKRIVNSCLHSPLTNTGVALYLMHNAYGYELMNFDNIEAFNVDTLSMFIMMATVLCIGFGSEIAYVLFKYIASLAIKMTKKAYQYCKSPTHLDAPANNDPLPAVIEELSVDLEAGEGNPQRIAERRVNHNS